jgi:hypothetical protein
MYCQKFCLKFELPIFKVSLDVCESVISSAKVVLTMCKSGNYDGALACAKNPLQALHAQTRDNCDKMEPQ